MNLKEAFRYQNKIQTFIGEAQYILENDANITKVANTHLRSKVMPEVEDETICSEPTTEFVEQITDVVRFMLFLLKEKEKLFAAIRRAKNELDIDVDSEVSLNNVRQSMARTLDQMNQLRCSERIITGGGTGYRFNTDGNQVTYRCDVKRITIINYDRNVIRAELTKLNKASDEVSAQIDLCFVNSTVDYEPLFDVNENFNDAFETFMEKVGA